MSELVDLKRTKADKKAEKEKYDSNPIGGEDYPYGLSVDLDHESLGKLGITTMPKAGDKLHLHAHAHVKSVREEQRDGGKKHRHMSLELRKMALKASDASEQDVHEGKLRGAKAAMDKALDKEEGPDED